MRSEPQSVRNLNCTNGTTVNIPDGKWVQTMSKTTGHSGYHTLVGTTFDQVDTHEVIKYHEDGTRYIETLVVSDDPFGLIYHPERSEDPLTPQGFYWSYQVENGCFGSKPPLLGRVPKFVREKRKRHCHWLDRGMTHVNLALLASTLEMDPADIVATHLPFQDFTRPDILKLKVGGWKQIRNKVAHTLILRGVQEIHNFLVDPDQFNPNQIWITRGWALCILYLRQLNETPETVSPKQLLARHRQYEQTFYADAEEVPWFDNPTAQHSNRQLENLSDPIQA